MAEPPEPTRRTEPLWLEPYPDALLEDVADRPRAGGALRGARVGRARVHRRPAELPPRQRAVLVLRDVLGFRTAEVAEHARRRATPSVKGALQRARATLREQAAAADRDRAPLPNSARERELVGRFADAVESGDVDDVVALLTDDALLTMPPQPLEYQGHDAIAAFLRHRAELRGAAAARRADPREHPARVRLLPPRPPPTPG